MIFWQRDVPPIPPHATFEQAKDAATALLKGDPNRWGILNEGLAKAREVMPGKDSWGVFLPDCRPFRPIGTGQS